MITNFFIPVLNNHDVQELWFQQDGATCHTARATIDLLKDTFGDRLISRFGPVNWPPRSCDLTPLDYFLWGYVRSLVYADKPQTLDHLEDNIRRVIADIRPQMLEKVMENWTSRLDYIRASRGSPMPEIIFKMDISPLKEMPNLHTLILDHNLIVSTTVFPKLPSLQVLWLNFNLISDVSLFIPPLSRSCPNLRHLSLMGNMASPIVERNSSDRALETYRPRGSFEKDSFASLVSKLVHFTNFQKNPKGPELATNGRQIVCQSLQFVRQVTNLGAKNDANLTLAPRFRQIPIESPL
ncbi:uncharacterized protein TNCV_970821 [Trichonephila clavipes]|nr:uncharacterized protein TNCV_970821 [Trichonephila clavipes]